MMRRQLVWVAVILVMALWIIGACAEPSQGAVTAPLIGENREIALGGNIPQQLVVIVVTPTPAGGQQVAQADTGNATGSTSGGQAMTADQLTDRGEEVFANNCATCHGPDGEGGGSYPALAGNSFVTNQDPNGAISTVLQGRGQMPSFGDQLTNEQVAAVLSYVRNAWGNNASAVHVDTVSQVAGGSQIAQAQGGQQQPAQQQSSQGQDSQQQNDQQQGGKTSSTEQQANGQQGAQQQGSDQQSSQQPAQQESQPQNNTQSGQQSTAATVSTEGGTITLQIQIMIVTPEPSGAASGAAEATPAPSPTSGNQSSDAAQSEATPSSEQTAAPADEDGQAESSSDQSSQPESANATGASTDQAATPDAVGSENATDEQTGADTAEAAADTSGGQQMSQEQLVDRGEDVFGGNCATCHGGNGQGGGSFPALAGNPYVTSEDPSDPIMTVLQGRGQMPSFGDQLPNEDIAAVLTYVRNAWGNNASAVHVGDVAQVAGGGQAAQAQEQSQAATQEQTTQSQTEQQQTQQQGEQADQQQTEQSADQAQTEEPQGDQQPAQEQGEQTQGEQPATQQQADQQTSQEQAEQAPGEQPEQTQPPASGAAVATVMIGSGEEGEAIPIQIMIIVDQEGNVQVAPAGEQPGAGGAPPGGEADQGGTQTAEQPEGGEQENVQAGEGGSQSGETAQSGSQAAEQTAGGEQLAGSDQQLVDQGSQVFMNNCAACHQPSGQGIEGIYPALAGNPFVTAEDPEPMVQVVVTGRAGMPHFGPYLAVDELAAVVSYIRNAWGNNASVIPPDRFREIAQRFESVLDVMPH